MTLYEENINLQEALVRESKNTAVATAAAAAAAQSQLPPSTPKSKIPLFINNKKPKQAAGPGIALGADATSSNSNETKAEDKGDELFRSLSSDSVLTTFQAAQSLLLAAPAQPAPANDHLIAKCKAQEEQLLRKDDELRGMQNKLQEYENHLKRLEAHFQEQVAEVAMHRDHLAQERDSLLGTIRERNDQIEAAAKGHAEAMAQAEARHESEMKAQAADTEAEIDRLK
jgi:hypothetical protein